jgi:uncharacterized membrane protein
MPTVGPLEYTLTFAYGLVAVVVVVVFLYALIVLAARVLHRILPATPAREDQALATLRERFARGEIDEVEYQHQRSVLQGS